MTDQTTLPARSSTQDLKFSVVIPNYNYGHFIGSAIESALAVQWDSVEVIVVDDGSTDDSVSIARSYEPRITVLQQENSGPRIACNRGFAASSGDLVMFLDSDDSVEETVAEQAFAVLTPATTKIQFQMRRIDADGKPSGHPFPRYRATPKPDQIRKWMRATSAYPTPPGSGNVYTRAFLAQLFPLDDVCGDATDSACLAAAPFLGDVQTVDSVQMNYRQHGSNRSFLLVDPGRFSRQLERALQRHRFAQSMDDRVSKKSDVPLMRGRHLLQLRIAERKLIGGTPSLPGDSWTRMLRDSLINTLSPGPESLMTRTAVALWCVATLLAPLPLAERLIRWRFRQGR